MADGLPPNVRVTSFYYSPGSALGSGSAQRSHVSTNYTHVVRDVIAATACFFLGPRAFYHALQEMPPTSAPGSA
jgi:hypothetical protein